MGTSIGIREFASPAIAALGHPGLRGKRYIPVQKKTAPKRGFLITTN
jgi:hypothetical protein